VSEFLAEASVLVRPDTTKFRAELAAQLAVATRGVSIPIPIVAAPLAASQRQVTAALTETAAAAQVMGAQQEIAARKAQTLIKSQSQLERGAASTALSLVGVRGATLAASSSFLAGAAAVAIFSKAVGAAASLEEELNVFRVTAQATADQMQRVGEEARKLGADISLPGVSATDAAQAFTELARAGLDVQDALAGGRGVLQLATAAQLSFADAAELTASALNAFGLEGEEAIHVADLLANAANEAQGGIGDMGLALRQSAAAGRLVGLSLDDTVALLTLLARNGLQGSDAGTSLRVALLKLVNPTKQANQVLEQLNVTLNDAQGNLRPDIFAQIADATEDLGIKQRRAALGIIFGTDAIRAQSILGREGADALDEMSTALDRQGAAAELAGARAQGFSGQMAALSSNLETLGTTLGSLILPPLELFTSQLNDTITTLNRSASAFAELVSGLQSLDAPLRAAIPGFERFENALGRVLSLTAGGPFIATARQFDFLADQFGIGSKQIQGDAKDTAREVRNLFSAFQEAGGGPVAVNTLVVGIDKLADKLAAGDQEAQRLAAELREVKKEIIDFGNLPPTVFDIEARLDKNKARQEGKEGADILIDVLRSTLSPEAGAAIGFDFMQGVGEGIQQSVKKIKLTLTLPELRGQLAGLSEKLIGAQIEQDRQAQLAILREQQQRLQRRLEVGIEDVKARRELKQQLLDITNQIRSIEDSIVADQERAAREAEGRAREAEQARRERDAAFLDLLGGTQQRAQSAIIAAQGTKTLADDLKTNLDFRSLLRKQVDLVKKTVEDAKTRAEELRNLARQLIQVGQEINQIQEQIREARRQERRERRERIRENLELSIQIAEATGNRAAEVKAREAEIARIQLEIRQTRKGSLQRKRLILELRQTQAELREIQKEKEKTNKFAELAFGFLQQQQGFAANLLSNLIPAGAAAGTVGGVSPPAPALPSPTLAVEREGAVAQVREEGLSRGQGNTQIQLLRDIKRLLIDLNIGTGHPEAKHQRITANAAFDMLNPT
jgi:TP901 family phage tail tape measure protein